MKHILTVIISAAASSVVFSRSAGGTGENGEEQAVQAMSIAGQQASRY